MGSREDDLRLIAFFLPQFHPIPENDEWWGKGFTEWTNVVRSRPKFPGHQQPHLPTDLGFYDLRLPEARQAQAELARTFGISAFCWYHYWFNGRRLLERPFNEVLASGEPDFPFVLCWANENWTRVWDGGTDKQLISQDYSAQDDVDHLESLLPAFHDPRYLRVDDRPVFLVYHASNLPDPQATCRRWRHIAEANGLDGMYLARVDRFADDAGVDPRSQGFDAAVEFQPDGRDLPPPMGWSRTFRRLHKYSAGRIDRRIEIYDYPAVVARMPATRPLWTRHGCVSPGWDNSSRRRTAAVVLHNSTAEVYQGWLERTAREALADVGSAPLVFVNAWNEWAEGAHLEPDSRSGLAYLRATREALQSAKAWHRSGAIS